MLQAIALDGDRCALTILDVYCQRADGITLCRIFTQPQQALVYLQRNQVDLVFTETQFAGGSGIAFWQSVGEWAAARNAALPGLIFTTKHSEYAVQSYEVQAIDYLLKPVSFERFSQALRKATNQLITGVPLTPIQPARQRCFRVDYGLVNVNLAEITCVEALGNYCKLHLVDQHPLVIRSTMKSLLNELPDHSFMQVHRSYIVATDHIRGVRNKQIYLPDKQIPVGTHYERIVCAHFAGSAHSSQL